MAKEKAFGLALSGGGYRAAAFHLGTLRKLHELGLLEKVDVLSTVSGGSITGACYCLRKGSFEDFDKQMTELLTTKNVIRYVLLSWRTIPFYLVILTFLASLFILPFTFYAWTSAPLLITVILLVLFFQFRIFPASGIIEEAYNRFFYKEATLSQLPTKPILVINATNIQTCRPFAFSLIRMEDSTYRYNYDPPIEFLHKEFPVARAVMASSCVPFAFTPVGIGRNFYKNPKDADRIDPRLIDGGVFDNQGVHKISYEGTYACNTLLVSDAGTGLPFSQSYNNVFVLLIRTMNVFMARIKNVQITQNLYRNTLGPNRQIAYLSLNWTIETCLSGFLDNLEKKKITDSVIACHKLEQVWIDNPQRYRNDIEKHLCNLIGYTKIEREKISDIDFAIALKVGTNLTSLSIKQANALSGHAANLTEIQLKLYCPSLLNQPNEQILHQ